MLDNLVEAGALVLGVDRGAEIDVLRGTAQTIEQREADQLVRRLGGLLKVVEQDAEARLALLFGVVGERIEGDPGQGE